MKKNIFKLLCFFCFLCISNHSFADVLKKIEISGNNRISNETIKVYGDIQINKDYTEEGINNEVIIYINRLSDLLFVMARHCNDNGKADILWQPGVTR